MIDGLKSGKIGFAALDTIENEAGLYYLDRSGDMLDNPERAVLMSFPNVFLTPHMAF
jgi:D-lactate dehydrogenase